MNNNRPKYLTLHQIRLPLPGLVSILHRVSGTLLFLVLPLLLWTFQYSLLSIDTFTLLLAAFQHPLSKLSLLVLIWAFLHHLFAGIRYLALDMHQGASLARARASSLWVLGVSLALTVLAGVKLW